MFKPFLYRVFSLTNRENFNFSYLISKIKESQTPYSNVNEKLIALAEKRIIHSKNHPLWILKNEIKQYFNDDNTKKSDLQSSNRMKYEFRDDFLPLVTTEQCFDDLLVPKDHISRKTSDSYYISENIVLRTHTSAHQKEMMLNNNKAFCVFGDCYRRDTIDASHYPIFHQMEGVRLYDKSIFSIQQNDVIIKEVVSDLQQTLENLIKFLFGNVNMRWIPAYFPFTDPSFELEIFFNNEWMEMLGCGIIHKQVMKNGGRRESEIGWAAGLGLERFAMQLFGINDIRLFWSEDPRFLDQFKDGKIKKFAPFSKYPICYKDFTFWLPESNIFEENELCEVVRNIGGDLIEKVECRDTYIDKKKGKTSKCYRIYFRSLERTLQNSEINVLQQKIRDDFTNILKFELR